MKKQDLVEALKRIYDLARPPYVLSSQKKLEVISEIAYEALETSRYAEIGRAGAQKVKELIDDDRQRKQKDGLGGGWKKLLHKRDTKND